MNNVEKFIDSYDLISRENFPIQIQKCEAKTLFKIIITEVDGMKGHLIKEFTLFYSRSLKKFYVN
jgi:hypothetical protein